MHFDLHEDSPISEYSRVEIYGLDYDTLTTLGGTLEQQFNNFVTAGFTQYKLARIRYQGNDLYNALSNTVPTDPAEQGGCVFNRGNLLEDIEGTWMMKDVTLSPIPSTQPSDWGTSIHYYRLKLETLTIDGNPAGAALPEWMHVGQGFNPNDQYYHDDSPKEKQLARHFYFNNGLNVVVTNCVGNNWGFANYFTAGLWIAYDAYKDGGHGPYCLNLANNIVMASMDFWGSFQIDRVLNRAALSNVDPGYVMIGIALTRDGVEYVGFALVHFSTSGGGDKYPDYIELSAVPREMVADNVYGTGEVGKGEWGPTSDTGGGGGNFDNTSDNEGDGSAQSTEDKETAMSNAVSDAICAGYQIHQLLTTNDYMTKFYKALFATGTGSYLERFFQSAYDPMRAIIAFHKLPQNLIQFHGNPVISSHVTAAGYDISQKMNTDAGGSLNVDFPEVMPIASYHMDKITFDENGYGHYFDAFPDFAPYTKAYLHLPYIGVQEIDVNKFQYGALQVSYFCEAITGNVTAHVWCSDREGNCRYCYICTGNAAYKLPVYSAGAGAGAISSGISAISAALSGNVAGAVMAGASSIMGAMQQTVQASGSFGGNFGAIGEQDVWLELVRPQWIQPEHYQKLKGLPSWISGTIAQAGADGNQLNGFTVISEIDLDGVTASEWEKTEIAKLLAAGIEIKGDL